MPLFAALLATAPQATSPPGEDLGRLLVLVAVPAAILGAFVAAVIKRAVLSRPRYRDRRPGLRTFVWIMIADMAVWGVLWPSLLAVRIQGVSGHRALWVIALLLVVALGYIANRYGFAKALDSAFAGNLRGTLLAELFTILMPVFSVCFGLVIFWLLVRFGV